MTKRFTWPLVFVIAAGVIIGLWWLSQSRTPTVPERVLNLLCWTGYEEPAQLEPFERKYGVKVRYKTFVGGDSMYSLLTQSKGQYDVVTVDPEYIKKLHDAGRLSALNPADYNLADYLPTFRRFPLAWIDEKMYAIPVAYGALGLVYNTNFVSAEEAQSYDIILSPKLKGKVSVWDWYLPIMGVVSRSLGNARPYDIRDAEFEQVKVRLMQLRPQLASIAGSFPELMASLASGDTLIVPGGAGWVAANLQAQGKPYDWSVPKQGGIMWADTVVIPSDAPHPDLAKLYVQWMTTPEAQALVAQKKANSANVPNGAAYPLIPESLRKVLKTLTAADAETLAEKLVIRTLPTQQSERTWQNAWEEFKAGTNQQAR